MRDPADHDPTDPALRQPIETAPRDGRMIQVGGPYAWTRCRWNDGSAYAYNVDRFVIVWPGHHKDGSLMDMNTKKFWRPDHGES